VWWSTEDNGILVNLDADKVKPEPKNSFNAAVARGSDDDDDNRGNDADDSMDYSIFHR
jgi:hypothetical protein